MRRAALPARLIRPPSLQRPRRSEAGMTSSAFKCDACARPLTTGLGDPFRPNRRILCAGCFEVADALLREAEEAWGRIRGAKVAARAGKTS